MILQPHEHTLFSIFRSPVQSKEKMIAVCKKKLYTIVDCILLMIELRLCKTKLIILSFENWTIKHRIYLIFNQKTIINNIFESILQVYIF